MLNNLGHFLGNSIVLHNVPHGRTIDCIKGLAEINEIQIQQRLSFKALMMHRMHLFSGRGTSKCPYVYWGCCTGFFQSLVIFFAEFGQQIFVLVPLTKALSSHDALDVGYPGADFCTEVSHNDDHVSLGFSLSYSPADCRTFLSCLDQRGL